MKKIFTFPQVVAAAAIAFSTSAMSAADFTVLETPADVLANSVENQDGAKAAFQAVVDNAESTEAQIEEAMHTYFNLATPAPGYAFNMSYLLQYNEVTAENKGKYTKAKLAEAWKCDVAGVTPDGSSNTLMAETDKDSNETYMRIYSASEFKGEASYNTFAAYQLVSLGAGSYELTADAFVKGGADCAVLAAGDNNSAKIKGAPLKEYVVDFTVKNPEEIKIGLKRNDTAGNLTHIAFNNVYIYKVSNIVVINDESKELAAATDVKVVLERTFEAGNYYPICLPFAVENWSEIFEDVLLWSDYEAEKGLSFRTISADKPTQARKPYLVKVKNSVTADNYLTFDGVTIQAGNAGSWVKSVEEGQEAFPVTMKGNWEATTVPADCYYFDNGKWTLSDGTAQLPSFSAYIATSGLTDLPETAAMLINGEEYGGATLISNVACDSNAPVNVYNLQGVMLRRGVAAQDALAGLPKGIYIVNGKKIVK